MEFRVLGPLEVIDGGVPLALGGPRQRLVLASLILDANRVVPTDRLIDRIWGDEPPDAVRATLFAYISRLRKLFGAGRIRARPPGYILLAERDEIDLFRFSDLVEAARRQREDRGAAAALLTQALALWRGGALSDLADYDAMRPAITQLEELRLGALEDRIEADIALGRHRESVALLEGLTTEYPLRERLWSHLILALYRSGRQGDALGAFHRARTTLVEELGIDPSPDLRRLEVQVLNQDPALDLPTSPMVPHLPAPEPAAIARGDRPRDGRRRRYLLGAGVLLVLVAAAAWWARQSPQGLPQSRWTIGLEMPLSGANVSYGVAIRKAVQMAVDEVNAGGVGGSTLDLKVYDDAPAMELAPESARALVDDPAAIAMIGPFLSAAAFPVLPITNQAGLLQCSPSNTHPGLTKPRYGALDLRPAHPDARNYVRLPPADDIQAVALASFAYRDLAARSALVIDEIGAGGREVADAFEVEFGQLGGTTLRRSLNPGADPLGVLEPLDDELNPARLVFFVGSLDTGAAVRVAMADGDHLPTPLLSWDALLIGSGFQLGEPFIELAGTAAVGSYVAHASLPDQKFSFADAYRQKFGSEPDEYSAAGYACVEIIVAAMRAIAADGPAVDQVRDLIRAYVVDPAHQYETVLGTVRFDANGDALRQFVTFYRAVTSATTGAAWVVFKKQDFGPPP